MYNMYNMFLALLSEMHCLGLGPRRPRGPRRRSRSPGPAHMRAYVELARHSSEVCVPCSTSNPSDMTRMRSASTTVCSLCATSTVVTLALAVLSTLIALFTRTCGLEKAVRYTFDI